MNIGQTNLSVINSSIVSTDIDIENKLHKKTDERIVYRTTKRIADVMLSSIALIVLFPVFLLIGIAIKIDSRGSIFFAHKRIGKNGKSIYIYKFRTMLPNAEEMIQNFSEDQMKEFKQNYKLKNDPRITRVGKILRKTSLDELPQIVNILKGDLSIIGPRPVIKEELALYGNEKNKFLSVTPGLTGYWQANGRSTTTYEERINMELYYIDNRSLWLDIKIFFKTFISVIKRDGAV